MTIDEKLAGLLRTGNAIATVGDDVVSRIQAVRVAAAEVETQLILVKDEYDQFKGEAAGRETALKQDIDGLHAAVSSLQADKLLMQETIDALMRQIEGSTGSVPPPAAPPAAPPPAAPPPAPAEEVPPLPPEIRKRPTIGGDAEVGASLTRTIAEADPGWEAYQGRWYVYQPDLRGPEIGGQGMQPTDMVPPGAKVVYREWFRNEAGRVIDAYSLPFGPFVQRPKLTGRIQIPATQEQ